MIEPSTFTRAEIEELSKWFSDPACERLLQALDDEASHLCLTASELALEIPEKMLGTDDISAGAKEQFAKAARLRIAIAVFRSAIEHPDKLVRLRIT